jgi:branched-chain amino acid aminotransferase
MAGRVVYVNGEFVPESEAKVSIYDSALMFGDMVFEMTRSFNKRHFKLREHVDRLYAGLKYLHIPIDMTPEEMIEACNETTARNEETMGPDDEHRLMIDVTRGLLGLYEGVVGGHVGTNVFIADFPLRWTCAHNAPQYVEGLEAVVPSQRTIPADLLEPKVKNRSRIHYLMANIEISNYAGKNVWALLLDPDGFVAEGTGANFFIIKDGALITPEPRNILLGVTRNHTMGLARQLGMEVIERNIGLYDVANADEAFFTSTPFCMLPVLKVNGATIGAGKIGPMYAKLMDAWSQDVGLDIIGQIMKWHEEDKNKRKSNAPTPYSFRN